MQIRPVVLTTWFFGVAIIAGFLGLGARAVGQMCREADRASQPINEKARAMAQELGLRPAPSVLVHPRVEEPFLCGIVRPAILLPGLDRFLSRRFARRHPGTPARARETPGPPGQPRAAPRGDAPVFPSGCLLALAVLPAA